jgi:hypothetical protein
MDLAARQHRAGTLPPPTIPQTQRREQTQHGPAKFLARELTVRPRWRYCYEPDRM